MIDAISILFPSLLIAGIALAAWSLRKPATFYDTRTVYETGRDRLDASPDDVVVYVNDREVWRGPGPVTLRSDVSVVVNGDCASVASGGNVRCAAVHGDVNAGGNVTCPSVTGDVSAGGNATVGQVGGDVSAGGNVKLLERKR